MSVNGASTVFRLASWMINAQCNCINPESSYPPPKWAKMLLTISLTPPEKERQWSVNDSWSGILETLRAMEWHWPTIHLSAAYIGKNASDNIRSTSYNSAPTECQQFLWELSKLCSNEMHWVVATLSFARSVFSIYPCIQLHKSACHVSQMWLFSLVVLESVIKNPHSALP